ncbi:MAG: hypothetical protein P4M15_06380, partial [Alphaproteobacteria bacterium]|nr:hypothetical protein [Alphaproteobacteria bacterium]
MTATIDVKVGVQDDAFNAYAQKFAAYCDALDKMPEAWKNVAVSSQMALAYTKGTAVALNEQADEIDRIAGSLTVTRRESETVARHWRGL